MKKIIFVFFFLLLLSCSKVNTYNNIPEKLLELNLKGRANVISKSENVMYEGVSMGIYVPYKDSSISTAKTSFSNRLYTSGISGSLSGGPVFLTVGKDYDIYGYAPYQQGVVTPESISGFKSGDDVMFANKVTVSNVSETNSSAILSFEHLGSQISFSVECEDPGVIINQTSSIEVSGFYNTANLNLTNRTLIPIGSATPITSNGTAGALSIQPFCFFITTLSVMELDIKVTIDGVEFNGTISKQFVAGESYRYTVTIPVTTQELKLSATLTPWVVIDDEIVVSNSITSKKNQLNILNK
ncbi:MAG: fimbrillin family protein [Bacteroidales bacterium]